MVRLLALFLLFWIAAATDHGPHKPTTTLFQYVPPCLCLLRILSVCISPPCHVYVPFVCMSRREYVPSVCISFRVYVPSFVCPLSVIMYMSRHVYVPPCVQFTVSTDQRCLFHHVYVLCVIIRDKGREGRFGRLFLAVKSTA